MRKFLIALVACFLIAGFSATGATAGNPSGHGQPSVECGPENPVGPPGFDTPGFANAETKYAGALNTPSAATGNPKVVAQYDVACFQLSH